MKSIYIVLLCILVTGCASTPRLNDKEITPDQTLSTLNDTSRPSWANEGKPFYVDGPTAYSVGVTTMYGNERPEAGMRVAENNSRANFAKTISNKMAFFFQNAEENGSIEGTTAHYIGSEASELTTHHLRVESYWYKRYVSTQEDGRHIYYKIYALTSMPTAEIRNAVEAALSGRANEHSLSEGFKAKADTQFGELLGQEVEKK